MADKKFTVDYGDHYVYGEKLFTEVNDNFVLGFSGDRGAFELFRTTLEDSINDYFKNVSENLAIEKLILMTSDTISKINNKFRNYTDRFDAILGISTGRANASLKYFYPDGRLESIDAVKVIGTGEPYGRIFPQKWHPEMTMEQVAKMGHFIIKYIERFELTYSVGVANLGPQILFLPDPAFKDIRHSLTPQLWAQFETSTERKINQISETLEEMFPMNAQEPSPPSNK